ncbi:MAG: hypothetical protein [Wendovervirus sonii]|uniref:Uncharacterized protein n=1 Tax=phage Lak_Megaphage_Sonny TaxID=3109229 RepID=A0ABZ0Z5G0_9CAUD|nr:MAG: hypothetical protein [phage Lak_Megaphage_Sonny]
METNKIDLSTNNNGRVYSQPALADIAIMIKDSSLKFGGELTHPEHSVNDTLDIFIEPRDINDNELQQRLLDSFSKSGSANSEFFEKFCKIIPIFSDDMEKNEKGEITKFNIIEFNVAPKI